MIIIQIRLSAEDIEKIAAQKAGRLAAWASRIVPDEWIAEKACQQIREQLEQQFDISPPVDYQITEE